MMNERVRVFRTANLFLSFLSLGLVRNILGPTLPIIESNIRGDSRQMGYVLAVRFGGGCVGAVLGGILFSRLNRQLLFVFGLLVVCFTNAVLPYLFSLNLLIVVSLLAGTLGGDLAIGGNVLCLDLWPSNPGPYLQALHFFFSFGSVVAPLIAGPFLSSGATDTTLNSTFFNTTEWSEESDIIGRVDPPYLIVSAVVFLVATSTLVSFLIDRSDDTSNAKKERVTKKAQGVVLSRLLLIFAILMLAAYCSIENSFAQFLSTFVITSKHQLSKSEGSYMLSLFWAIFCLSRAGSIYCATKVKPFHMLLFDVTIIGLSTVLLAIWGEHSSNLVWVASAILGLGAASTYPTVIAWTENYVGISNALFALFQIFSATMTCSTVFMVGHFLNFNPQAFLYIICALAGFLFTSFAGQFVVVSMIRRQVRCTNFFRDVPQQMLPLVKENNRNI